MFVRVCEIMAIPKAIIRFMPEQHDVRRALDDAMALCRTILPAGQDDALGNAQIVLAEALNNVAEHAFAQLDLVEARLTAKLETGRLLVTIRDRGQAMPGLRIPEARHHDLSGDPADLPEGGFGWMLIHELTDEIRYDRINGVNRLRLWFQLTGSGEGPRLPQ